jgi:hypothetical protein
MAPQGAGSAGGRSAAASKKEYRIMSTNLSRLRRAAATFALLLAVGSGVSACADIRPDNTPHSPVFRNYGP